MERVLEEPATSTIKRYNSPQNNDSKIVDGKRVRQKQVWVRRTNMKVDDNGVKDPDLVLRVVPDKVRPNNVFRFKTAGQSRDNEIRHPAAFHRDLPKYFIKLLTDEGDVVLDVFSGIGTSCLGAQELNRKYLGFELNPTYAEFSINKLTEYEDTSHTSI
jgi:DNA modification methylase